MGEKERIAATRMRIVWTSRALKDLAEIREYVAQDKPVAAEKLAGKILSSVELLAKHPRLGRVGREPETRELLVVGTPYILPYQIHRDQLAILAVLHGARKRS